MVSTSCSRAAGLAAAGLLVLTTACADEPPPPPQPRPVSIVELRTIDPVEPLKISGSVKPWKEQDVAFEVGGRVKFVVDSTTYVQGRWMQDGEVVQPGDVLARLDPREYQIAVDTASAAVHVAQQNVELARVELQEVLPAAREAARADRDRAQAEYVRIKKARESGAVAEIDLIRSTADRDEGVALLAKAEADIEAKKAEIESLQAKVQQAQENLAQAEYDLERCTLYAPLTGEVAEVWVEAGGYVKAGTPVAHLVMTDPIKVDLSLSAATARKVKQGDRVRVYSVGSDDPLVAWVYQIATVADAETRTFRVSLMCRNEWSFGGKAVGDPLLELPRVSIYARLIPMRAGDPSSAMAVEATRALQRDPSGQTYVWASDDVEAGRSLDRNEPTVTIRRVDVELGEERRNFQGLFELQSLTDVGDLSANSMVLLDPPAGLEDGDRVLIAPKEWRLRSGQIVHVLLEDREPSPGLWVAMNRIKPIDAESGYVFVEKDSRAHQVRVKLLEKSGELARIEAHDDAQAELLQVGAHVIAERTHTFEDGEKVRVVEIRELGK